MKTRTLLLLAVATGLAILVAGGIQLIRVSNQDESVASSELGAVVEVGDMDVIVRGAKVARPGTLLVDVSLGGVDDADATEDFSLLAPGAGVVAPEPAGDDPGACGATTSQRRDCTLTFDVSEADGDVRTLRYQRGDDTARWPLP